MIYLISDSELRVLCNESGFTMSVRSPLETFVADKVRIEGQMLEDNIQGLIKLGLFEKLPSDDERISAQGLLLAKILMRPEYVLTVGRKKSDDGLWHCCCCKGIWYVFSHNEEMQINTVFAYFNTNMMAEWLSEQFTKGYQKTINPGCGIDLELNYNEWFMFLMSQFVYIKRKREPEQNVWFDRSCLTDANAANYLKSNFRTLNLMNGRDTVDKVLEQTSPELFEITLDSLVKKNVFTSRVDENGNEEFSLTNVAAAWLDNDILQDTVFFDFKGKKGSYTILFSLREDGILAMVDNGKTVRFVSSDSIPWKAYLSVTVPEKT